MHPFVSVIAFTMPILRASLCGVALCALASCQKEPASPVPLRVTSASAPTVSSPAKASDANGPDTIPLRPLPDAMSPRLGSKWNDIRATEIAVNAIERLTNWPTLGLCESACRIDAHELVQGEEPRANGSRHLVVLAINGGEEDGSGAMLRGTTIGVCTFERQVAVWTLAECRQDAARLPRAYGDYDRLEAHVRSDAAAGVSIVVDWAQMATGEQDNHIALLRRVDGRFTNVLDLATGEDTQGNYADRPDIETGWTTTWAFQDVSTPTPDIVATATGHRGRDGVDCKAHYHFDGGRYQIAEISTGTAVSCPWRNDVATRSSASATAGSAMPSALSPASAPSAAQSQ